jgi:hypothetical protein
MTPTQRLLKKVLADRGRWDQQCKMGLSPPGTTGPSTDVEMKDAFAGLSPVSNRSGPLPSPSTSSDTNTSTSPTVSPVYPLPSQAAHSHQQFKVPVAPRLQLSTLPPVPVFPTASSLSTSSTTPTASTPLTSQSPSALPTGPGFPGMNSLVSPSPVKKKLSLTDYKSRRMTSSAATPGTEKTQAQANSATGRKDSDTSASTEPPSRPQPDETVKQEAAAQGGLVENAIEDTPMKDDGDEPEYNPPEPVETVTTTKIEVPALTSNNQVSSLLASIHQMDKVRRESAGSS